MFNPEDALKVCVGKSRNINPYCLDMQFGVCTAQAHSFKPDDGEALRLLAGLN